MACYLIGWSLSAPGRDDEDLVRAVERMSIHAWPCTDNIWVVSAWQSASALRDALQQYLSPIDQLIVAGLAGEAAWVHLDARSAAMLRGRK